MSVIFLCAACLPQPDPAQSSAEDPGDFGVSEASTRVVRHALGRTAIPLDPQRVAVLSPAIDLDNILALGIRPAGISTFTSDRLYDIPPYLADQTQGIPRLGTLSQPNLERIALLNPDLIIIPSYQRDLYPQLSEIAPTVATDIRERSLTARLRQLGNWLNRSAEAEVLMTEFEERVATFQTDMKDHLDQIEVSVLRVRADGIFAYIRSSPTGLFLDTLGIHRPPAQDVYNHFGTRIDIRLETLHRADGDIIFVWGAFTDDEAARERLFAHPLWQQLSAVQRDHVYVVPESYWAFSGIQGFHRVVDDLYTYLVNPLLAGEF